MIKRISQPGLLNIARKYIALGGRMIIVKFLKTQENFGFLEDWAPEGAKELHNLLLGLSPSSFYGNGAFWHWEPRLSRLVPGDVFVPWLKTLLEVDHHLEPQDALKDRSVAIAWLLLTRQLVWSIPLIVRKSTVKNRINGATNSSLAIYRHS